MKSLRVLFWLVLLAVSASAQVRGLVVREVDGSPRGTGITEIVVSNTTLTINGQRAIITTGGGGGSGITVGTTTVTSGTATRLFYETAGNVVGQVSGVTSDGTNVTAGSGNLRATSPRITTGINDANGNVMLAFSPAGSATEYITIANNTATNAVSLTASSPTVAASAQAGTPFNLTASAATAGDTNAGAAVGGSLNFSTGSAARLTSGNAAGGSIVNFLGAGIGTGARGTFQIRGDGGAASSTNTPEFQWYSGYTDASNYSRLIFGVRSGSDTSIISERAGTGSAGQLYIQNTTGGGVFIQVGTSYRWSFPTTGEIGLSSNALSVDAWIRRNATANIQFGQTDAASPVAQTLSVQNVVGGTSNTAGANWTLAGSRGTGTGAGGSIIFQTAPAGGSGTSQNSLSAAFTVNGDGSISLKSVTFANLPTVADAKMIYCSDCTIASPCASGGSGALAKGINGAWVCN